MVVGSKSKEVASSLLVREINKLNVLCTTKPFIACPKSNKVRSIIIIHEIGVEWSRNHKYCTVQYSTVVVRVDSEIYCSEINKLKYYEP